jgi:hypothetical protein
MQDTNEYVAPLYNYLPPHWPKFNGKYPEDMEFDEIKPYIDNNDFVSLKKIILYSRGYLPDTQISKAIVQNTHPKIISVVDTLIEMVPQSARNILNDAVKVNALEIVKHIGKYYKNHLYKRDIENLLTLESLPEIHQELQNILGKDK